MSDTTSLQELIERANQNRWPLPHDPSVEKRLASVLTGLVISPKVNDLLLRAAASSPYLERLILRIRSTLPGLLSASPDQTLGELLEETRKLQSSEEETKSSLRNIKDRVMLTLSLCDLCGRWSDLQVMEALSHFADAAVCAAFTAALRATTGAENEDVIAESGFVILAMGKHGAFELNYSSDIDLVVFYDPETLQSFLEKETVPPRSFDPRKVAVRITQNAVSILQDQTSEGYVFRTDLRLRPDPGSSSAAVPLGAAERYYENHGQNWERAAFSKARIIAGNHVVKEQVRAFLNPFIWRKFLDFAAIEDVHSIKRQIHAVKGAGGFEFPGHDIKLGRGGIREVEFYVQTQQLILGGKNPALRERTTLGGLQALASSGHIQWDVEHELRDAYLFLRRIEHRIQMINDEQTHQIPRDSDHILRLAHLAGYESVETLESDVRNAITTINDHYADLFEEGERLSSEVGSLVFTGVDDHPDTLQTLQRMGFSDPSGVSVAIRQWHAGGIRATRSARAREILTRLVPVILQAMAESGMQQQAFEAFDRLLRQMPAGVQFFSLVQSNPKVLESLITLATLSPRLAKSMAVHPHLIETLLNESFLKPESDDMSVDVDELIVELGQEDSFEEALNVLRREVREARFQVTCRMLMTETPVRALSRAYSGLADSSIEAALPVARQEMIRAHGEIPGGLTVIGLGRLGASNLTIISDLDLIFIYDVPDGAFSDHAKPLDAGSWYARYVRRIVTALSAQTEEGSLYDVDMALRPSGAAGPTAVRLSAFRRYYQDDAWTWEEMAMVKARVIAGDESLVQQVGNEIEHILGRSRGADQVRGDVLSMRYRLLKEKPPAHAFDLKRVAGGLTDVDFICQYLALIHAAEHGRFPRHIVDMLPVFAAAQLISEADARTLSAAWQDYEIVLQLRRTALGSVRQGEDMPPPLMKLMAERLGTDTPDAVLPLLASHSEQVQDVFRRLIGTH